MPALQAPPAVPITEPESRLIEYRSEFIAAVRRILPLAHRELIAYDTTLADWGLDNPDCHAALRRLAATPGAHIRLLVHDPAWVERHAPRLAQLRDRFGETLTVHRTLAHQPTGICMLAADRKHLLRRAHCDQWRGRLEMQAEPRDVEPWVAAFQVRWEASEALPAARLAGL